MEKYRTAPVTVFNTMSNFFGIHSQVIDFGQIVYDDVTAVHPNIHRPATRQPKYLQKFWILCGVAFTLSYPVASSRLFLNYHFWAAKSINFYLSGLYYSTRFFLAISIFFMQIRCSRESCAHQCATIDIFRQIYKINRFVANAVGTDGSKRLVNVLTVVDWWQLVKLCTAFGCYVCANYLKLTFIFQRPGRMNAYDLFWFYYANMFIRMYASMFSISILQQAKLYELLNQTIKSIKKAADESMTPGGGGGGERRTFIAYSLGDFEKHINLLMTLHEKLRENNLKLDKLHSVQAMGVVANGLLNLTSQVIWHLYICDNIDYCWCVNDLLLFQLYFAYNDVFFTPNPPKIMTVFTVVQACLHFIEVTIIFDACETLKNKVCPYPLPFVVFVLNFLLFQMNGGGRILHEIYNKKFSLDLHRSVSNRIVIM